MVLRHFTPYVDDLTILTVEIPHKYAQELISFTLVPKNEGQAIATHIAIHYQDEDRVIYRLLLSENLDLDCPYWLVDNFNNRESLIYRNIVRTPAFDAHFFAQTAELGALYRPEKTQFSLWAPISEQVLLHITHKGALSVYPLQRGQKGIWSVVLDGDYDGASYSYLHQVNGSWKECSDPYALSSQANSGESIVINPDKLSTVPPCSHQVPHQSAVLYEMSVRDFSSQGLAGFKHPAKYSGLTESPNLHGQAIGFQSIKDLGVTHVQLLPVFDFGSVDELNPQSHYNWGYDPVQYGVPEGSFASDPTDAYARILEFQTAISHYHQAGIGVVLDVVYNHVYDSTRFVFEQIVPGYTFRVNEHHQMTDGSWCGNDLASERLMLRKHILDTLKRWVVLYGVDGFRFDLMGLLDYVTMQQIDQELTALSPNILLYGEGWRMHTGLDIEQLAHQDNAHLLPGIGFFNDDYRDTFKHLLKTAPSFLTLEQRSHIENLLTGSIGIHQESGRFLVPSQSVNYLECHDNATLFDDLCTHLTAYEGRLRASFGLQLLLISHGMTFLHSGQEFFRTKCGLDNTYNSPDSINQLDWESYLVHQDHVAFIRQFIAFRKEQSAFSIANRQSLQEVCDFYWLTPTVLRYRLKQEEGDLEILINFSASPYPYHLDQGLQLRVSYPAVGHLDRPKNSVLEPFSLVILQQTTGD